MGLEYNKDSAEKLRNWIIRKIPRAGKKPFLQEIKERLEYMLPDYFYSSPPKTKEEELCPATSDKIRIPEIFKNFLRYVWNPAQEKNNNFEIEINNDKIFLSNMSNELVYFPFDDANKPSGSYNPKADIEDTHEHWIIYLDAPGFKKKKI